MASRGEGSLYDGIGKPHNEILRSALYDGAFFSPAWSERSAPSPFGEGEWVYPILRSSAVQGPIVPSTKPRPAAEQSAR